MDTKQISAADALERLKEGNRIYIGSRNGAGDVSPEKRQETSRNGQHPYAVVVSCADSRVIPESIFSAGIGEIFVIRVAGNVIGDFQLGSVEYAVEHLGAALVVVMGHTGCGAVGAAMKESGGHVRLITDEIRRAIGSERDVRRAEILNVHGGVRKIKETLGKSLPGMTVRGALYHTDTGAVDFLDGTQGGL